MGQPLVSQATCGIQNFLGPKAKAGVLPSPCGSLVKCSHATTQRDHTGLSPEVTGKRFLFRPLPHPGPSGAPACPLNAITTPLFSQDSGSQMRASRSPEGLPGAGRQTLMPEPLTW